MCIYTHIYIQIYFLVLKVASSFCDISKVEKHLENNKVDHDPIIHEKLLLFLKCICHLCKKKKKKPLILFWSNNRCFHVIKTYLSTILEDIYYPILRINHHFQKCFPRMGPGLFDFHYCKKFLATHATFLKVPEVELIVCQAWSFWKQTHFVSKHIWKFVHIHSAPGGEY